MTDFTHRPMSLLGPPATMGPRVADAPRTVRRTPHPSAEALSIAFVGTYPPRLCGIATFTSDLAASVGAAAGHLRPTIVALTDPGSRYDYPREVGCEIRQDVQGDYVRAAEMLNGSARLVCIQHEHGIFGGDDGAYVLDLLDALRVPAVATLHTVLKHPSDSQRAIVRKLSQSCARTIVMSRVARELLHTSYGIDPEKISVVPHGIPDLPPRDPARAKERIGAAGRRVLLTFGLLGPNKGIEMVVRALPGIVAAFPDVVYFVVGATHPQIVRRHGEEYRTSLVREAERLGVRDHVVFRDRFVASEELGAYLQAADVYVSPYQNEAQVTSGALSYAMGAGAAVVSTPYWHAQELLSEGRGRLFGFGDSASLETAIVSLLGNPTELDRIRRAAFEHTRTMLWPEIGKTYLALATDAMPESPMRIPSLPRSGALPALRLDHLVRLTDDTGVIQHATYTIPDRKSGYCVDDNARALVVALKADRVRDAGRASDLVTEYLAYLHGSQDETGDFANIMHYDRTLEASPRSEDTLGRALWALGTTIDLARDDGARRLAREMFDRALPRALALGPRGTAWTMLGLSRRIAAERRPSRLRETLSALSSRLVGLHRRHATPDWSWFEPILTYDNACLPFALFEAFRATGDAESLRVARESLALLERDSFADGWLALVGNAGWQPKDGPRAVADEQGLDAAAFVLAFKSGFQATGDPRYLRRMRQSFAWFLGANRLRTPLYDERTAGCRDGLGESAPNENQGAESTISFLLALLEMLDMAEESSEPAALGIG